MATKAFIATLVLAAFAATAFADSSPVERLPLVYAHLRNAEQMATGGLVISNTESIVDAKRMKLADLKKECLALVDRTLKGLASAPAKRKPETFAYLKDAMLRLTVDRAEPHHGHVGWARAYPTKVTSLINEYAATLREGLVKL